MLCVLFRHGIAVEQPEWHGLDADRPLTERGLERTAEAAAGLARLKIKPAKIFSSPYRRARETASILHEVLAVPSEIEISEALIPSADPEAFLQTLNRAGGDGAVICVGHEPHLSGLAGVLVFGGYVPGLMFKKAGACCLEWDGQVKPGEAQLRWWLMPAQLRALGEG